GIAAGMKLNEMIKAGKITEDKALMGYVGAYTYAEVMSGYTSFYLGAKSVCPSVKMNVKFTGSWYDYDKEKAAAESLISGGCVIISQHADSYGAPEACEAAGVPNISYNGSTQDVGPKSYIVSSKIDWTPYFKYMINCAKEGKKIDTDWTGTIETGSVKLLDINKDVAAEGTQEAIDKAIEEFKAGTLKVFDTANFTVEGKKLDSYKADVDSDEKFEKDTEVISNGIFEESKYRSAPYFDLEIDGITLLDRNYG
ncbi:MAG: BMP family ABC transporter substrate-binding protein, partial [Clostridia bacterium]|nr:BMP family ABC transporter substrate-binding protein [Clostridia bacterium]